MSIVFTEQEKTICGVKYVTSNAYISESEAENRAANLRERGYDAIVEIFDGTYHVMTGGN